MSITIYTYRDPYRLPEESYWNEIRFCPYFCASQTLVNGLKSLYPNDFKRGRVTTVQNLVESAFEDWEGTACAVRQYAAIDRLISEFFDSATDQSEEQNILRALRFNRDEVFKSIRILFELNIDPAALQNERLTREQSLLVAIYRQILNTDAKRDFTLPGDMDAADAERIVADALRRSSEAFDREAAQKDRIVIHGVHQFTPIMLRVIEQIARYKRVILLFNYQRQYKNLYQTWINIYAAFDCPIAVMEGTEFRPDPSLSISYAGNLLADQLGKMIEGKMAEVSHDVPCEILEFDSVTEFANYAANLFEEATRIAPGSPMSAMREQIYSADAAVNNILRIYFPEQFGERQFLNYPLGRFFVSIANMWNEEKRQLVVSDLNDVRECLCAGIIQEVSHGELSTLFRRAETLFDGCSDLKGMAARLKRVKKNRNSAREKTRNRLGRLSYYALSDAQADCLIEALMELERLAAYFCEDFSNRPNNFRRFYSRLRNYLQEEILDRGALDEEFADIVKRVLMRLDEVADIDVSASFECLRSTMSLYLSQQPKPETSANWIVRTFEQLDGDILRSRSAPQRNRVVYHFACLSDEDLSSSKTPPFPWPLSEDFFQLALEPVDWKSQVYLRARKEYPYFKRYALLYALEFNRADFKLSYVRCKDDDVRDFYYLLKLYGVQAVRNPIYRDRQRQEHTVTAPWPEIGETSYTQSDLCRFRLCRYRFLTETLVEGASVYKDSFLQLKYLDVWLEHIIMEELQGLPNSAVELNRQLDTCYEKLKRYFPFAGSVNRADVINSVRKRLERLKYYPRLDAPAEQRLALQEDFLRIPNSNSKTKPDWMEAVFIYASDAEVKDALNGKRLSQASWQAYLSRSCQFCANKELCARLYSSDRGAGL